MENFNFMGGIGVGLIVNYLVPPFRKFMDSFIGKIFHLLNPNKFDLSGSWDQTFTEPVNGESEERQKIKERIVLKQFCDVVTGEGKTSKDNRIFNYKFNIRNEMIFGSYTKKGEKGNVGGSGMIQLIVDPGRRKLVGQATWLDTDTKKIETSESLWEKR